VTARIRVSCRFRVSKFIVVFAFNHGRQKPTGGAFEYAPTGEVASIRGSPGFAHVIEDRAGLFRIAGDGIAADPKNAASLEREATKVEGDERVGRSQKSGISCQALDYS
jgi:hypothetical protein